MNANLTIDEDEQKMQDGNKLQPDTECLKQLAFGTEEEGG